MSKLELKKFNIISFLKHNLHFHIFAVQFVQIIIIVFLLPGIYTPITTALVTGSSPAASVRRLPQRWVLLSTLSLHLKLVVVAGRRFAGDWAVGPTGGVPGCRVAPEQTAGTDAHQWG